MAVFDPYLSSRPLAEAINSGPEGQLILEGHYYPASSVGFYTGLPACFNGRADNLVYGSGRHSPLLYLLRILSWLSCGRGYNGSISWPPQRRAPGWSSSLEISPFSLPVGVSLSSRISRDNDTVISVPFPNENGCRNSSLSWPHPEIILRSRRDHCRL
jgi:hypothetical protein